MLQGRKRLVTQYYDTIRAFKLKLSLWETQLSGDDTAHFLCLKSVRATGLNSDLNQYKDNRVVAGVQATVSGFRPTWDGLPSLFLAIHNKSLWSAHWLATWNNWLAVWFRFEDQVCLGELGHILSVSFSKLPQSDVPCFKSFVHIWDDISLWTSVLCDIHQCSHMVT